MFKNYLKTAWRNLWKTWGYSLINIMGLSIGMAACIVILLFVSYERGFDQQHHKNIYRLNEVQKWPGMVSSQKVALTMYPMGKTMKNEFPQILQYTHVRWYDKYQITNGDQRLYLPHVYAVDTPFFNMFDFPLLRGDRATALRDPNSLVLTETTAHRLFGNQDPMGKTIKHFANDTTLFKVTGVLADIPENSQFQFDALASFSTWIRPRWDSAWGGNWLNTYFELAPG